jgi:uroporphyrinogen decarboxylase
MKPRDRVLEALAHSEPDRVPTFFLGFTPQWVEKVINRRPRDFLVDFLPMYQRFDSDLVVAGPDVFYPYDVYATQDRLDEWGRRLRVCGLYSEFVEFPIKRPEDIDNYHPPDPHGPKRTREVAGAKRLIGDEKAVMSVVNGPFEPAWQLRGLTTFLKDIYVMPSLADKCLEIATDFEIEVAKELIDAGADIIMVGDDYGWQGGLVMSPNHWRRLILPRLRRVVDSIKSRGLPVVLHSDGNITSILDDLVKTGLDGLNPIQARCGLIPGEIKKKYPQLAQVGTVDIQHTLPFGTRDEIEGEIRNTITAAGSGAGLIMGPQHAVQPDVPVENVDIMIKAIRRFGRYPIE